MQLSSMFAGQLVAGVLILGAAGCLSDDGALEPDRPSEATAAQDITGDSPWGALVALGGRCLQVDGNGQMDRTPINIYDCFGGPGQYWSIPMGLAGPFVGLGSQKVLDVPFTTDHTKTWIFGWWGGQNQLWSMPSVEIHGLGGCLDVPFSSDGSIVWMFQCWGGSNQKWFYNHNTKQIQTGDGRCLEYFESRGGAQIFAGTCTGGANQLWYAGPFGHFFTGGNLCLDVTGGVAANRTPLQLSTCTNNFGSQTFSLKGSIVGLQSGKCFGLPSTVNGPETWNLTQPEIAPCSGGDHQQWEFRW